MRRVVFLTIGAFTISASVFGQSPSSDQQTLQALLAEVRALRQDLHISLARVQSVQILLSRLQMQQGVVARASEHLDDARSKLSEVQLRQKEVAAEVKRLEDSQGAEVSLQQQKLLQDRINHVKSELEVTMDNEQQRQATEIQAEQQLRAEQDKLNAIEVRLDDLLRRMDKPIEPSGHNLP